MSINVSQNDSFHETSSERVLRDLESLFDEMSHSEIRLLTIESNKLSSTNKTLFGHLSCTISTKSAMKFGNNSALNYNTH